jgi:glucose/arabinose dehydrogenase
VLQDESCEGTATANAFECSAPLPTLSAGQHTLELAAFVMSGDLAVESAKSPGLQVTVAASTVSAAVPEAPEGPPESPDVPHDGALTSAGGLPLHVEIIARGLSDPVDLAAAPDGRLLVAERNGRRQRDRKT